MEKITDSINKLIIETQGGLLAFWGIVVYSSVKGLQLLGGCLAEGAINKGITKIVPMVRVQFRQEFEDLRVEIAKIDEKLTIYKHEKHTLDGENKALKEVIILNDSELTKEIQKTLLCAKK